MLIELIELVEITPCQTGLDKLDHRGSLIELVEITPCQRGLDKLDHRSC
jgi:predicted transposase YbfD/YdcC